MNRNYKTPAVDREWSASRNTDHVVAVAIHAISTTYRSAEEIWENPSPYEWDNVLMAVEEYVTHGDYERQDSYNWGEATIFMNAENWNEYL